MTKQHILPLTWPTRYDTASFLVDECNKLAYDAVMAPDGWADSVLLIQGPIGSGKTHLMTIYIDANNAVRIKSDDDIDLCLVSDDMFFAVDDIDALRQSGKITEEKLFHLYNHVKQKKGRLLLTLAESVSQWSLLPDLSSRLQSCPLIQMENPNEEMLKHTYQKLFADRGLFIDERVLDYLVMRSERSFAGMHVIVDTLDRAALQTQRRITIPLIQTLDLFSS